YSTGLDPTSTLNNGTTVTSTLYPPDTSSTSNIQIGTILTGGSGGTSKMQMSGLVYTQVAGSKANDTYNLTYASGGNITLTRDSDGVSQTIAVPGASYGAGQSGTLNWTTLGVALTFTVNSGSFNNTQSASVFGGHSITTVGESASVSSLSVSAAPAQNDTYTLTSAGSNVTLTRASDAATQTLTATTIAAGGSETFNFSTLGINFTVTSTNGIQAANLADALSQTANKTIKTQQVATTQSATVSNIDLSAAPAVATTYTFTSSSPGTVTLTRASD